MVHPVLVVHPQEYLVYTQIVCVGGTANTLSRPHSYDDYTQLV